MLPCWLVGVNLPSSLALTAATCGCKWTNWCVRPAQQPVLAASTWGFCLIRLPSCTLMRRRQPAQQSRNGLQNRLVPLHLQIGAGLWSQLISLGGWEPSSPAPIDLEPSQLCGVVVCAGPMLLDLHHNDLLFQVLAFLIPCDLVGICAFASACGRTC